jgi:hypothetical protein
MRTPRDYLDFVIDGVPLSSLLRGDVISRLGWGARDSQMAAIDRLRGRRDSDLPGQRTSLYVCPECGDLGCGAVSLVVEAGRRVVIWKAFGFQNDYEDGVDAVGFEDVGPFTFEGLAYHRLMVLLHGFMKKTQKTPATEIALARRRKKEIEP